MINKIKMKWTVQILNKMVHLKYPILEILWCTIVINILPNCLLQGWNLTQSWGKCSQLIWHKAEEYVLKLFGSIALHKSLLDLETKKIEFFTWFGIWTISYDNKPCPRTHEPPSLREEPESKTTGFVAPILKFPSAKISNFDHKYVS